MLREHQLYTKFSKCDVYKSQIQYLGHIIFETRIAVDPKNIRSIKDFPTPTNVTEIRSFLGLAGYYQKFIEKFSRISCPMTTFQKKTSKFLWNTKCEEIFQKLKQLLMPHQCYELWIPMGILLFAQMQARKDLEESSCRMIAWYATSDGN